METTIYVLVMAVFFGDGTVEAAQLMQKPLTLEQCTVLSEKAYETFAPLKEPHTVTCVPINRAQPAGVKTF